MADHRQPPCGIGARGVGRNTAGTCLRGRLRSSARRQATAQRKRQPCAKNHETPSPLVKDVRGPHELNRCQDLAYTGRPPTGGSLPSAAFSGHTSNPMVFQRLTPELTGYLLSVKRQSSAGTAVRFCGNSPARWRCHRPSSRRPGAGPLGWPGRVPVVSGSRD